MYIHNNSVKLETMFTIFAAQALLPSGWSKDVQVSVDDTGRILDVTHDASSNPDHRVGVLLPAPVNVHSHGFQRAMAGLTERRGPNPTDSFWTWRDLMFRFLDQLTPEHVQAITAFVQMEMLEAGYAANVEFHYLHHQPGGQPYNKLSELCERVAAGSITSGIGLTLLPVHYQYGGCDKRALGAGQIRFGNDLDRFAKLFDETQVILEDLPQDAALGLAPHSLRAVGPENMAELSALANNCPIHMHLAEQIPEVEEVLAAWGKRPVEWVLDNVPLNEQWCMIHCTQMQPHETVGLAKTGVVAGLCPITESSLGDGIFDGVNWLNAGGKIAVGSDSNMRISLSEEIRTLDYSQRLRDNSRAALATADRSTARRIMDEILVGGAQVSGRKTGAIEKGKWADLVTLDANHVDLDGRTGDTLLDCFAFAGDDRMIRDVWSGGRHQVQNGEHINRQEIVAQYRGVMKMIGEAM